MNNDLEAGGAQPPESAPIVSAHNLTANPTMSQVYDLGKGFDIFKAANTDSLLQSVFLLDGPPKKTFTFLDTAFSIPSVVDAVASSKLYDDSGVCESRESFQNKVAARLGVEGSYGAFSAQFEGSYGQDTSGTDERYYAFRNTYFPYATLELTAAANDWLTPAFKDAINALPTTVDANNLHHFARFFETFGIYYTSKILLGGTLQFYTAIDKSTRVSSTTIDLYVKAEYDGLVSGSVEAKYTSQEDWQKYSSNRRVHLIAAGGDAAILSPLASIRPSESTKNAHANWIKSVPKAPAVMDFSLTPISRLCGNKAGVVETAWKLYARSLRPKLTVSTSSYIARQEAAPIYAAETLSVGSGTTSFRDFHPDSPVKTLTVYADNDKIRGIEWTHEDGKRHSQGSLSGSSGSFTFEPGERLKNAFIGSGGYGYGSWRRIQFSTTNNRDFAVGNGWPHGPVELDVNERYLLGFFGVPNGDGFMNRIGLYVSRRPSDWSVDPLPSPPVMILGGKSVEPAGTATTACGFHVAIIDGKKPTGPNAIKLARRYEIPRGPVWTAYREYERIYENMLRDLKGSEHATRDNLLVIASYGLAYNMAPTPDMTAFLRNCGAGDQLMNWVKNAKRGEIFRNPVCYILAGRFNSDPKTGTEIVSTSETAELAIYLYAGKNGPQLSKGSRMQGEV